jgi:hypothetical protein
LDLVPQEQRTAAASNAWTSCLGAIDALHRLRLLGSQSQMEILGELTRTLSGFGVRFAHGSAEVSTAVEFEADD